MASDAGTARGLTEFLADKTIAKVEAWDTYVTILFTDGSLVTFTGDASAYQQVEWMEAPDGRA